VKHKSLHLPIKIQCGLLLSMIQIIDRDPRILKLMWTKNYGY